MNIRLITPQDNHHIKDVIQEVLTSFGANREGFAWADPELDDMFAAYQQENANYWVLADGHKVYGGGGIAPMSNVEKGWCELQKMYFLPEARGKGYGNQMMEQCLAFAKKHFNNCYLETLNTMNVAQHLYARFGFTQLSAPMGNTGHSGCDVWMFKKLG